jgi:hypothetical protein
MCSAGSAGKAPCSLLCHTMSGGCCTHLSRTGRHGPTTIGRDRPAIARIRPPYEYVRACTAAGSAHHCALFACVAASAGKAMKSGRATGQPRACASRKAV